MLAAASAKNKTITAVATTPEASRLSCLSIWRSIQSVTALAKLTGWDVTVVKGAGHMLPKEYVGVVLEGWFGE